MNTYLAFDIGGTQIKYGTVNDEGAILNQFRESTPKTLDELLSFIEQKTKEHVCLDGVAVSSPGSVGDDGVVYGSSALPYLHGPNIKQLITERVNPLPVFVENDANCAAYAELWQGNAKGKKDVLVMVIGTGIGGAIIQNGTLFKGANLHAGDFGYMLLTTNVKSSDDVWSRVASTAALVKKVAAAKRISPEELSGEEIFELAEKGDPICKKAVDEWYHLLAIGIYNMQYIYDPEVILVGGGISARPELIDCLNEKLDDLLSKIDLAKIKPVVEVCHFRQNANLLGAVFGLRNHGSV